MKNSEIGEGINRNGFISETGTGRTSIFQYLQILRDANLIEYTGSKKTGGYFMIREAKEMLQIEANSASS